MKKVTFRYWLRSTGRLRLSILAVALLFSFLFLAFSPAFFIAKHPLVLPVRLLLSLEAVYTICSGIVIVECIRAIAFRRTESLTLKKHFTLVIVLILVFGGIRFIIAPLRAKSYYHYGLSLIEGRNYSKALRSFDIATTYDPSYANAYHERAYVYGRLGNYTLALTDCNRAIQLAPKDPYNYAFRGQTYYHLGKYREALNDFEKAISLDQKLSTLLSKWMEAARKKL